jgi:hypothetical protein
MKTEELQFNIKIRASNGRKFRNRNIPTQTSVADDRTEGSCI